MVQLSSDSDEEGVLVKAPSEKFQLRNPIRPYVTSTSEDFEEERNFLSEQIFPVLNQQCQLRGCSFSPINIQWQPGDNVTLSRQLLRLNLDCISKCSPFFICLLGQTYGPFRSADSPKLQRDASSLPSDADWLDWNYVVAASAGYSWILHESRQNCSITELEIIQAAFLSDNQYCYFYYRQPEHLDTKLEGVSNEERDILMNKFLPSSEDGDFKIRDLKQRIVKKGISVKYFRTLEELGDHVLKDWSMVVDEIHSPLISASSVIETEEYREWIAHESFAENHRHVFVTSPDLNRVMEELTDFATGVLDEPYPEVEISVPLQPKYRNYSISNVLRKPSSSDIKEKNLMILTGDRGSGKSTLVANWIKQFKEENPEIKLIFHFVGCNGRSRNISVFLRHCIKDLREKYLKDDSMLDDVSIFEPGAATTFQELYEGFLAAISLGPCVLVVEGVDEVGSTLGIQPQQIKKFEWIPLPLPSNCRMILTTSTSDFSYRSLSERGDIKHLTLPHLNTPNVKKKYLEEQMQMHYKHLKDEHFSIICESKLSSRPQFLTLLGDEIKSFSVYSNLKAFLENTVEMCSSLRDLFTRCIKRWKKELSWSWEVIPTDGSGDDRELEYTGWIPDVLRLLAVSRSGLTQREILDVLYQIGYQEDKTVSMFDWLLFQQCVGSCLYEKPNGLVSFSHQHMREIVEYELLRTVKPSAADVVPLQSDKDKVWKEKKKSYHKHLVQYFSSLPISQHCLEELPFQLLMSGDMEGLTNVVTAPETFMMLADLDGQNPSNVHDLHMYWHYLQSQGVSPAKSYLQVLVKAGVISHELETQELSVDGSVFEEENGTIMESSHNGSPTPPVVSRNYSASPIQGRQLSVIEESLSATESESNLARHMNYKIINKTSKEQIAGEMEEMDGVYVTESKSSEGSLPKLVLADGKLTKMTWHIGVLLRDLGETSVAEKVFIALHDLLYKNFPLSEENQLLMARVQEVLGRMHLEKGNADEAEKLLKKTLRTLMDIPDAENDSPLFPCVEKFKGEVLSQIGYLRLEEGILDDAEDLLQESLELSDKWGTLSHRATILFQFGLLRVKQGDFMMAENSLRNALTLRERWYGKSHPLIAEVLFHLAMLMCNPANDRFDKYFAEDIFRRALDIRESYFGKEHILCGDVLFELGRMLSEEPSFAAKMEACRILSKALDIRIRKLGEKHIDTRAVRHYLNELEISIKKGKYEYGPSKPTDVRTLERPFSSLSWRENDLENLGMKYKTQPGKTKTPSLWSRSGSRLTVSRPGSNLTGSRPGSHLTGSRSGMQSSRCLSQDTELVKSPGRQSNLGYLPMSERLLLESDRPRLLQQRSSMERRLKQMTDVKQMTEVPVKKMVDTISSMKISPRKSDQVSEETSKQQITVDVDFSKVDLTEAHAEEHVLDSFAEDSYKSGVKFALVPKVQVDEQQNVEISPTQPPVRLFKRLGSAKSGSSSIHSSRHVSVKAKRPGGSARSVGSSLYTAVSNVSGYSMDSTSSRRTSGIPAGPDSILTNARTATIGPYSSVQSILPVECPRDISRRIHHKSAWYHVPGRYKTPKTKYPPKRSQRRPGNFIPPEPKITYSPPYTGDAYRNIKTCQRGHVVSFGPMEEIPNNGEYQGSDYANSHVYQGNSILDLSPTVTGLNPPGHKSTRQTTFIVDEAMPSGDIHVYPSHGTTVTFNEAVVQN